MTLTVEIDPARRTAAFREVSFLAAGDSCRVVLDGVRGADFGSLALLLYRDAASESPVASCPSFSAVEGHPALADGELALDTSEMAAWFEDAVPEESDDSDDAALPRASASAEPRLAARASLAERSVRADGWLVVLDRDRTWAACRVPVLLRPGAAGSGATDPTSVRALVEGLVSAALSGKADKAAPAASGNLASLDASGNLADSGATPASIKAAAVAEVVANAPGTMDTLKEIADILGSSQESGTVLKRILDLESGKADSSSLARVATSGSYDDLSGKPAIPAPVSVDATMTTQGAAADAKAVGDALRNGFTEWEFRGVPEGLTVDLLAYASSSSEWVLSLRPGVTLFADGDEDDTLVVFSGSDYDSGSSYTITATRHLITPTKTSQLTNDGDGTNAFVKTNDTRLSDARTPTAHHATHAANGSDPIAPADIGAAAKADLPYALAAKTPVNGAVTLSDRVVNLVEPVVSVGDPYWTWSDGLAHGTPYFDGDFWYISDGQGGYLNDDGTPLDELGHTLDIGYGDAGADSTSVSYYDYSSDDTIVATRVTPSPVSDVSALALPAAVPGKVRDFMVRLAMPENAAMFSWPSGVDFETEDGQMPDVSEPGVYLLAFTETGVGRFALLCRKVQEVE